MKKSYQFRALFYKNASIQSRQIGTNICQIMTPLICLILVYIIQEIVFDKFTGWTFQLDFPYLFNIPFLYSQIPLFSNVSCLQWYYYDVSQLNRHEQKFVGQNNGLAGKNMSTGLLNHLISRPGCDVNGNHDIRNVPFFVAPNKSINQDIYERVQYLNTQPFRRGKDFTDIWMMPDGAYTFHQANEEYLNVTIQVNDLRIPEYHRANGITKLFFKVGEKKKTNNFMLVAEAQVALIDLLSRAYLNTLNPNVWLVTGIQYMPLQGEDRNLVQKAINLMGALLFPLSLSLLLPVFLYSIVLDKEERLLQMMKMNGMKMIDYWIVQYVFGTFLTIITFNLFYFTAIYIVQIQVFKYTDPLLIILILTGWGFTQISMSFLIQVFLNKSRTATIIGYLISVWGAIMASTISLAIYQDPLLLPWYLQILPQVSFGRLFYSLSLACVSQSGCYTDINLITTEIQGCLISLYVNALVYALFGIYLHEIVPQEFGVANEPWICKFFKKQDQIEFFEEDQFSLNVNANDEDSDVLQEREKVYKITNPEDYPLICKDLRKEYEKNVAVQSFSLLVEKGEIFGLLGPNGAGKTSLISVITGLYGSDDGTAFVGGYDIKHHIKEVQMRIGVCPQFDLLWPELTVEEHLLFYARLKGVNKALERVKVQQSMAEVKLEPYFNYQTQKLSGGMKRRLSIAIALVGEPQIVFLDEPSTGLDPDNRRSLWEIIQQCRARRAIVLTTHSMDEADVLCNRIGIMSKGILRCIGTPQRLKNKYGGGYHLQLQIHRDQYLQQNQVKQNSQFFIKQAKEFIRNMLPYANLLQEFNCSMIFQISEKTCKISDIFWQIEEKKKELQIADWGISQTSLEDVFMRIVEQF